MREYHRRLMDWAEKYGCKRVRLVHKGTRHPTLTLSYNGKQYEFFVAGSPGIPYRAYYNNVARIKRAFNDATKRSSAPRLQ
jgi:hypothetical protein